MFMDDVISERDFTFKAERSKRGDGMVGVSKGIHLNYEAKLKNLAHDTKFLCQGQPSTYLIAKGCGVFLPLENRQNNIMGEAFA